MATGIVLNTIGALGCALVSARVGLFGKTKIYKNDPNDLSSPDKCSVTDGMFMSHYQEFYIHNKDTPQILSPICFGFSFRPIEIVDKSPN